MVAIEYYFIFTLGCDKSYMGDFKMNQEQLHEKVLYPVTRVRTAKAGGSGVVVYSKEDPDKPGEFINVVLTCEHVINDAVTVKSEWDSLLKREIKKDVTEEVTVEVFDYIGSKIASANSTQAEIIAYDKNHDLAAVKLTNIKPLDYVSNIYPENGIEDLIDRLQYLELDEVKFKQRDFYRLQQVEYLHRTGQIDGDLRIKW